MSYSIKNLSHLDHFSQALASVLQAGDTLFLTGGLGVGKTTFTAALCRHLGIQEQISSPTFTIVNRYIGPFTVYHLDLYRLEDPSALLDLDPAFYLGNKEAITLVEWAERLEGLCTHDHLHIRLRYLSVHRRCLHLTAEGPRYRQMVENFQRKWSEYTLI